MEMRRRGQKAEDRKWVEEEVESKEETTGNTGASPQNQLSIISINQLFAFLLDWAKNSFYYLLDQFSPYLPFYEPQLNLKTKNAMEEFRLLVTRPYDSNDPTHESHLLLLWKCTFPEKELEDRKTTQWKELGFQGKDPATDFRGGGFFALRNLVYLARKYPERYQTFLEGSGYRENFPVAITGLNITMMFYDILGWGMKRTEPSTREGKMAKRKLIQFLFIDAKEEETEDEYGEKGRSIVFHELYCIVFDIFEKEWKTKKATTLDFTQVISSTRSQFETLLSSSSSFNHLESLHPDRKDRKSVV